MKSNVEEIILGRGSVLTISSQADFIPDFLT